MSQSLVLMWHCAVLGKSSRMAIRERIETKVALLFQKENDSLRIKQISPWEIAACNRSCWCGLEDILCPAQIQRPRTFLSQDMLLFFLMWELELVPVYFLLCLWGGKKASLCSNKVSSYYRDCIFVYLIVCYCDGSLWKTDYMGFFNPIH